MDPNEVLRPTTGRTRLIPGATQLDDDESGSPANGIEDRQLRKEAR
jgi:hypothetical protein